MIENAFIRAILAAPRDTAPRLIYADWLEERGDPRAEYIRLLHALDSLASDDPRAGTLRERLETLEKSIDLRWRAIFSRGRRLGEQAPEAKPRRRRRRRSRREALESDVSLFLKQYGRKTKHTPDPNDRHYSREVEAIVKRMKPEEFDRLMRGEDAEINCIDPAEVQTRRER